MVSQAVGSRPLTPFMLFCQSQRQKDGSITSKKLGDLWQKLPTAKKNKYLERYRQDKSRYEKYLKTIYGDEPLTYKYPGKSTGFSILRVRGILGLSKEIKPLDSQVYPGIIKILVLRRLIHRRRFLRTWGARCRECCGRTRRRCWMRRRS
eukprot:TRINITY_DN7084_c0_g1_i2.p1 TRINITY_DN7084_c0_g1~~TRINITY_DN7084_c0_g1_i2.p1  ORF type:complete len:150 (-),score=18.17 TRINITY_DN7084_c0_g1_i2:349-798(-)